jgi:imidazolonepropionase-like amidohydrolase
LVVGASSVPAGGQAPAAGVTVFEGARLIVGDNRPAIDDATFVVDGTRITQVGAAGTVTAPAGARRVSLAGKTVMPTIVDTHVHLSQTRDALLQDLRRRAYWGISAALSLGQDTGDVAFQVRGETIPGAARLFTAGRGITAPEPGRTTAPYWVTTEAEARKAVGDLAGRRVDIVKIWVDDRNGQYKKLSPELYGAVIDEAHRAGIRVTAHIFSLEDAKGLLRAGVDAFAHGVRDRDIDDEILAMLKDRRLFVVVPNLPDRGVKTDLGWLKDSLPAEELQKLEQGNTDRPDAQKAFALQARNMARVSAAGVRIALGSDGNTPWAPHVEMADMVAGGMTPMQVIVAATSQPANFVRMSDAGTLEPGKTASFIVLDANPLTDITNTRRIASVYLRGAEVDRAAVRARQTASR